MNLTAKCYRGEGWWGIEIVELPNVFSQARRLDQVEAMAREAAAMYTGNSTASFSVTVAPQLSSEDATAIATASERKRAALVANRSAAEANRLAARRLADQGMTVRDVGTLLGVSYQRAQKLLAA
ncbi:MAG: hypothetical protein FWD29_08155 [Micrococcales bacterium]|nr:hypothetical protein [Micrococcales bacterium]